MRRASAPNARRWGCAGVVCEAEGALPRVRAARRVEADLPSVWWETLVTLESGALNSHVPLPELVGKRAYHASRVHSRSRHVL